MNSDKSKTDGQARANRRTAIKLSVAAVLMFGFGFALVPLYEVFCEVTGLNGKTGRVEARVADVLPVDKERLITVEFMANVDRGLPWEFRPMQAKMQVHPGETAEAYYYVQNTTGEDIIGQAVPSVAPGRAAAHFKKIECFCFSRQELKAREGRKMPVRFTVDPGLAKEVRTVTLSYTFFNADAESAKKYGGEAPANEAAHHEHHEHHHPSVSGSES